MMKFIYLILVLLFNISISYSTFQTSLFAKINERKKNKNLLISPSSIFQLLSITSIGARNSTKEEILQILGTKNLDEFVKSNSEYHKLLKMYPIEMANAIITNFILKKEFLNIIFYFSMEFKNYKSIEEINEWCNIKTHGNINKIIDELDPNLMMLIVNAIYFKGFWREPFNELLTRNGTFYNFNQKDKGVVIDFISKTSAFKIYENKQIESFELPLQESFSMLIILPKKNVDINIFIENMSKKNEIYLEIINNLKYDQATIIMPKFNITFDFKMKEILSNLGMKKAFTEKADFTGIREQNDLFINDIIQKINLKINEYGINDMPTYIPEYIKKNKSILLNKNLLVVDRPFIFIIRNKHATIDYDIAFISKIEKLD